MPARRFLAPKARAGTGTGYLSQPLRPLESKATADEPHVVERIAGATNLCDEPEALTRDEWEAHIDKRAKAIEEQRRKFESAARDRERRLLTFEQRLTTAHAEARRRCVDVSSEIRLLRHMQSSGKQVRHLEQRLGAVERKVWREIDAA
jgi:hypothetical protein